MAKPSLPSAALPASGSRGSTDGSRRSSQPGGSPALRFQNKTRIGEVNVGLPRPRARKSGPADKQRALLERAALPGCAKARGYPADPKPVPPTGQGDPDATDPAPGDIGRSA